MNTAGVQKRRKEYSLGYFKNDLSEAVGSGRIEIQRQKGIRSFKEKCEQRLELKGAPPDLSKASSWGRA